MDGSSIPNIIGETPASLLSPSIFLYCVLACMQILNMIFLPDKEELLKILICAQFAEAVIILH